MIDYPLILILELTTEWQIWNMMLQVHHPQLQTVQHHHCRLSFPNLAY